MRDDWPETELTTPTGLALMTVLADHFGWPSVLEPESVGIGLGHRQLDRPNLLRLIRMQPFASGPPSTALAGAHGSGSMDR